MKTITWRSSAARSVAKLPRHIRERLVAKLQRYAETGEGDVTKLVGDPGVRLRVGDYRMVFDETADAIEVMKAGHRRDVYDR